jgi:hypothetical protein
MKIALVICVTLLVISGERFWISMEDVGIRKRKLALQEEAVRMIRQSREEENAERPTSNAQRRSEAEEKL